MPAPAVEKRAVQPPPPATVPLTHLRRGESGILRIAAMEAGDAAFVRALGLRNDRTVRVCRHGSPCIVEVCCAGRACARVAIAPSLAEGLHVEPCRA